MRTRHTLVGAALAMAAALGFGALASAPAGAADPPAKWTIALLHVTYTDTTPIYGHAQLVKAAAEIHTFYNQISYGQTDLEVKTVEVTLKHPQEYYFNSCTPTDTRNPCPPDLTADAAQAAAAAGFDFSGIDGISVLSTFCSRDFTFDPETISRPGVSGTFGHSNDFECANPAPGPSGVSWGGWTHEFGHQLEVAAYGGFNWDSGHPSGYASGYDLMDSCYPCDAGGYSRLGGGLAEGSELVFGGWLKAMNVVTVGTPPGQTVVLTPLEQNFTKAPGASQAIKVPIAKGKYYLVEARTPKLLADALQNNGVVPRGIYDTGVKIVEVDESATPPETPINACDTTVPKGCDYHGDSSKPDYDPRTANCTATARPAYCWPFDLWHVGDTFTDTAEGIKIKVNSKVGEGFAVTVTRGVAPGHPDLFIVPWLTPPMNTYETVDIWVDSSCNGYESAVGPKGLLYGRRADGTVIGNGDDPCANHQNRVYANIHNIGDAAAHNAVVRFRVSNPLGVGVTGSWSEIGSVKIPSLAAGATQTVSVDWTPLVKLTPAEIKAGAFKFHSCIQVIIDPVAGEIVTSNNEAQENFDNFYAVESPTHHYPVIHGQFYVAQTGPTSGLVPLFQTVYLHAKSALPPHWTYDVFGGKTSLTLGGNTPLAIIPADIQIPAGAPVGQTYELKVQALSLTEFENDAIPPVSHVSRTHLGMTQIGGVVLSARGVLPSGLTLTATSDARGTIHVGGALTPHEAAVVAVDFIDPRGAVFTRYAVTDIGGNYSCSLPSFLGQANWTVRAFWQGDLAHAGVVAPERSLVVTGIAGVAPPPAYAKCPGS